MAANPQNIKQFLHTLADRLPNSATIDEALYHMVLRREIEAGLADSDAGRTTPVAELMRNKGSRLVLTHGLFPRQPADRRVVQSEMATDFLEGEVP